MVNQSETYCYDNLDRLESYKVNGATAGSFTYHDNGNMHTNSKVGTYNYGSGRPHAVTAIDDPVGRAILPTQCDVTYNLRNRPATLSENGYTVTLDYDASGMRRHTVITPTTSHRLDYIYAEGRIVAVHVEENGISS